MASPSRLDANNAVPQSPRDNDRSVPGQNRRSSSVGSHNATAPPWRFWLLAAGICLSLFLSMIDTSIVSTCLYTIGSEFKATQSVNWVALAYSLAQVGSAATFAQLSDIFGRRNTLIAANTIFVAFSLACGFSQSMHQLIAFRALQGIGGSGLYSLPMIILPEICPVHLKRYISAIVAIVIAGSSVLGPALGGILTHYATWRWVFWINGPTCCTSTLTFLLLWPPARCLPSIPKQSWRSVDALGTFLLISSAVLVVFAFQHAGESGNRAWTSATFIAPLTIGICGWAALFAWEYIVDQRLRPGTTPAFPIALFRNRKYASGVLSTMATGYPLLLIIFSSTTRVQVVSGKSALVSGLMLLPMLGMTAIGGAIAGKINQGNHRASETIIAGTSLVLLGCGLLTTVRGPGDDVKALGFLVFPGLGFGMSTTAATIMAIIETSPQDRASAQGTLAQLRVLGGSLGISVSTVLLHSETSKRLVGVVSPQNLSSLGGGISHLSPGDRDAVRIAHSEAFHKGMVSASIVAAVAVLSAMGGYQRQRKATSKKGDDQRDKAGLDGTYRPRVIATMVTG